MLTRLIATLRCTRSFLGAQLLDNAIKFTNEGEVALVVSCLQVNWEDASDDEHAGDNNSGVPASGGKAAQLRRRPRAVRQLSTVGRPSSATGVDATALAKVDAVELDPNAIATPPTPTARPVSAVIRFEVIDTGPGIPESFRENLFEPFVQSDEAALNLQEGTGLGLCISQKFVQAMGGRIHVESQLDRGSRFWFDLTLPLR